MSNKYLTIVIPTKDEDLTLTRLLDSLDNQSFNEFSVVVADDSSTDRVKQICNERSVYYVKGGLPGKARNNGAMHVDSELIFFMDADIFFGRNFVDEAIHKLQSKKLDCLSFGFFPNTNSYILKILHWVAKNYFFIITKFGFAHGIGGAILVRTKVHEAVAGFDEGITVAEDHNYLKRVSRKFRYSFTLNPTIKLNTRRFIQYGIFKMSLKYFFIEIHRIFIGEIRNNKIPYFENSASQFKPDEFTYIEEKNIVNG